MNHTNTMPPTEEQVKPISRLIDKHQVCDLLSLGKSTLGLWIKEGKFLQPYYLNNGTKALWFENEVHEWLLNNIRKQYGHAIPKNTAV